MNIKKETVIDIGDTVLCDQCNDDFTEEPQSKETGGFLFGSHGVCPHCAPEMLKSIKSYNEEGYIKAYAREGETFKDFILRMRGGDNTIRIMEM